MSPLFGGTFAIAFLLVLAALIFNIWMLVDVIRRPESSFNPPSSRVWWIVGLAVGLFLSWLGLAVGLVYFFTVRRPLVEGRTPPPLFGGTGGPGRVVPSGRVCPNCGHPLGTHTRFCQNCGTAIQEENE